MAEMPKCLSCSRVPTKLGFKKGSGRHQRTSSYRSGMQEISVFNFHTWQNYPNVFLAETFMVLT